MKGKLVTFRGGDIGIVLGKYKRRDYSYYIVQTDDGIEHLDCNDVIHVEGSITPTERKRNSERLKED